MGNTVVYGWPYPASTDVPDVPADIKDLAEAVEATLTPVTPVTAKFATGVTVTAAQAASGTTTSTTFTATLTGGTTCSTTFVAPPSGRVMVHNTANLSNSTTSGVLMGFEIRTGAVVGSGTVVVAADDDEANSGSGVASVGRRSTVTTPILSGLTPGATYNIRQMFRVSAGTGTFLSKRITVVPLFY